MTTTAGRGWMEVHGCSLSLRIHWARYFCAWLVDSASAGLGTSPDLKAGVWRARKERVDFAFFFPSFFSFLASIRASQYAKHQVFREG